MSQPMDPERIRQQIAALTTPLDGVRDLVWAFLRHPKALHYLNRIPDLGTAPPWVRLCCSDATQEVSGLIVGGQHDQGEWDLDGTLQVFSTDLDPEGEFVSVSGWLGEVEIQGTWCLKDESAPAQEASLERLRAAEQATLAWGVNSAERLRWSTLEQKHGFPDMPSGFLVAEQGGAQHSGLIVGGTVGAHPGTWNLSCPMRLITPTGASVIVDPVLCDTIRLFHDADLDVRRR